MELGQSASLGMADPECSHPKVPSGHVGSGGSWRCWPGPGRLALSSVPAPTWCAGTGGAPVQSVLRCTFPHLQGLLLTLQGPSGPSVTPGTPRARLPEGLAQDLGSEHSCTLPRRPRPCGVLPPQLNAPGDTLSCRRPQPAPCPQPTVTSCRPSTPWPPAHTCPPGGQPSPLPGLFTALSTGVCLWGCLEGGEC